MTDGRSQRISTDPVEKPRGGRGRVQLGSERLCLFSPRPPGEAAQVFRAGEGARRLTEMPSRQRNSGLLPQAGPRDGRR